MDLEQAIAAIREALLEQGGELGSSRDLFHFHSLKAAYSTYGAVLALLEPVRDMVGPEVRLQRAYLRGIAEACEKVAQLLRQVEG